MVNSSDRERHQRRMPKVLVVEKTANIQTLLRKQFSGERICVDATPLIPAAREKLNSGGYDVLIWDAAASKTEQSRGRELLDLPTKDPRTTYLTVVTDQDEPVPI